jgi:O-antigen ligase
VVLAASIGIALAPKSKGAAWRPPPAPHVAVPGSHPSPGFSNVESAFPLDSDIGALIGHLQPERRTLFGLTGRGEAWRGAIDLGNERPAVGYGFGTEGLVFVDRWVDFVGGLPENSYIGMYLQLGGVGVLALLALAGLVIAAAVRRRHRWEIAGPLGALAAGLILGLVQSYLYSAGNIATLALWTAAFVAAATPMRKGVHA